MEVDSLSENSQVDAKFQEHRRKLDVDDINRGCSGVNVMGHVIFGWREL